MNAPRYWELRDDACELHVLRDETSANAPRFSYPFHRRHSTWLGGALNFKGLSQDGGQAKFAENLRASPFN
jgi:hypothetical protein